MKFLGRYWWMCNIPRSKKRLWQLHKILGDLPQKVYPMTVSEFDGFITGILITPADIAPFEWLPHVWGDAREARFPKQPICKATIDILLGHFDVVASELSTLTEVQPIYGENDTRELFFWEPWVDGFMRAISLRPIEWQAFFERADEDVQTTIAFLEALHDVYTGKSQRPASHINEIDFVACDVIPSCIALIARQSRPDRCFPHAANLTKEPECVASEPSCGDP